MRRERVLDLLGIDVLPAADDQVLDAVHQGEVAVLVEAAHIAGVQPAADDGRRGRLRSIQVAAHDIRTTDDDFTDLTRGYLRALFVDDGDPLPRKRRAHRPQFAYSDDRIAGRRTGALGQAVTLDDRYPEGAFDPVEQFSRDRGGPADREPERPGGLGRQTVLRHEERVDGRYGGEVCRGEPCDVVEEP